MKDHLIENEYDRTYCVGRYRTAGYCYVGLSKDGKLLLGVVRRPKDKHKWLGELPTNKDCYDTIEASKETTIKRSGRIKAGDVITVTGPA